MKKAFTLIELILVIVILGILAGVGADIFQNLYRNYIESRNIQSLEARTQAISELLSAKLSERIKDSIVGIDLTGTDKKTYANTIAMEASYDETSLDTLGLMWYQGSKEFLRSCYKDGTGVCNYNSNGDIVASSNIEVLNGNISQLANAMILPSGYIGDLGLDGGGSGTGMEFYENFATHKLSQNIVDHNFTITNPAAINSYYQFNIAQALYRLIPVKEVDSAGNEREYTHNGNVIHMYDGANVVPLRTVSLFLDKCQPTKDPKFCVRNHDLGATSLNNIGGDGANSGDGVLLVNNVSAFRFREVGNNGIIFKICIVDPNLTYTANGNIFAYEVCKTQVVL